MLKNYNLTIKSYKFMQKFSLPVHYFYFINHNAILTKTIKYATMNMSRKLA